MIYFYIVLFIAIAAHNSYEFFKEEIELDPDYKELIKLKKELLSEKNKIVMGGLDTNKMMYDDIKYIRGKIDSLDKKVDDIDNRLTAVETTIEHKITKYRKKSLTYGVGSGGLIVAIAKFIEFLVAQ